MDEAESLRQQLRDEAAWRAFVEEQLAKEAEKAQVWRERAEQRAARIDRLIAGRTLRMALTSRIVGDTATRLNVPSDESATATAIRAVRPEPSPRTPSHPEVRAAALVASPAIGALVAELDVRDLRDGLPALRDVDLVVIEAVAWAPQDEGLRTALLEWLASPTRPPVACFGAPGPDLEATFGARDRVLNAPGVVGALQVSAWAGLPASPSLPRDASVGRWVDIDGVSLLATSKGPGLAIADDQVDETTALGIASAGVPVLSSAGAGFAGLPDPETTLDLDALGRGGALPEPVRRLAIRQRRWVDEHATPARRLREVLRALGVPHTEHTARLAVLLSSNRPELVPGQLAALAAQRRRPDDVRVALHGGADGAQLRAVAHAADEHALDVTVTQPSATTPLGSVLNELADATSADLLAKIDDDDHYGPAHLLDAEAALRRMDADLVGKKAHYVHLTGPDRTWLLAEDAEDTWTEQGVMGATFVWRRSLAERVRFTPRPRRVDSLYVRAAAAAGARVYALPANDFAYIRDPGGRTNIAGADYVAARGRDVGAGMPIDVIDV